MEEDTANSLLRAPLENEEYEPTYRQPSSYNPLSTFRLPPGGKRHYQQQYADIYFLRLARLKPVVSEIAAADWEGYNIAGEHAQRVDRVLDVRQGELSWVAGTVYKDLPLKPNILDDISKEHWSFAPVPQKTYTDPSNEDGTQTMLEDESGRLRLTGSLLHASFLVTGAVVAVLGTENANGDFEVIDVKVPDLPPQPKRWERDPSSSDTSTGKRKLSMSETPGQSEGSQSKKIAFVSGLGITGSSGDTMALSLLTDYLLGYSDSYNNGDVSTNSRSIRSSQISRLVIVGNSLGHDVASTTDETTTTNPLDKRQHVKKYGYDAAAYNASPVTLFDTFLSEILPSIPVTLMPGENDPANFTLPQQEIHRAMLPRAKAYSSSTPPGQDSPSSEPGWLDSVTNPWQGDIEGWRFWGCSGQNVDDIFRYLNADEQEDGDSETQQDGPRLRLMESMLRWRCGVPTAPDTLWCYPFQDNDPFVLQACPHVFFTGNQPRFQTTTIESTFHDPGEAPSAKVRLLALPRFNVTGEIVILDTETLDVEVMKFGIGESATSKEKSV